MIKFEDECVVCPSERGCIGDACGYRNVPHIYCDICGEEIYIEDEDEWNAMLGCTHHYHKECLDDNKEEEV